MHFLSPRRGVSSIRSPLLDRQWGRDPQVENYHPNIFGSLSLCDKLTTGFLGYFPACACLYQVIGKTLQLQPDLREPLNSSPLPFCEPPSFPGLLGRHRSEEGF